jgi:peptidoglycan/LPS O-acetylase OafA/YrhL
MNQGSSTFTDSKQHFLILDGLRGVAAVTVVIFHIFETFTNGDHTKQIINHGYLAVDFFFLLSGFVIGYAYDNRWGKMSLTNFFKRRLIRLHPMIIAGMIVGAVTFYFQKSPVVFPVIAGVPVWKLLLTMIIGFTLLPTPPSIDIRGWAEMHTLDGPAWSLFFEYVANILYALFIRKFSNTVLFILMLIAGGALIQLAVTHGDVIGGWSLEPTQLRIGFTRMLYPFLAGLLLSRTARLIRVKNAFLWCSLLLLIFLSLPRIGGSDHLWMNGLYDSLCIVFVFPGIVFLGASGDIKGKFALKLSGFLGDISYPLYITHYPFIYMFTAWIANNKDLLINPSPHKYMVVISVALLVLITSIAVAWACLKWYDIPVRKWLTKRFLKSSAK